MAKRLVCPIFCSPGSSLFVNIIFKVKTSICMVYNLSVEIKLFKCLYNLSPNNQFAYRMCCITMWFRIFFFILVCTFYFKEVCIGVWPYICMYVCISLPKNVLYSTVACIPNCRRVSVGPVTLQCYCVIVYSLRPLLHVHFDFWQVKLTKFWLNFICIR